MDELMQYLEQSVENVRGVDMVPLAVAIQAMQLAGSTAMLEELQKAIDGIQTALQQQEPLDEE